MHPDAIASHREPACASVRSKRIRWLITLALAGILAPPVGAQAPLVDVDTVVVRALSDDGGLSAGQIRDLNASSPFSLSVGSAFDLRNPWGEAMRMESGRSPTGSGALVGSTVFRVTLDRDSMSVSRHYIETYALEGGVARFIATSKPITNHSTHRLVVDGNVGCMAGSRWRGDGSAYGALFMLDTRVPSAVRLASALEFPNSRLVQDVVLSQGWLFVRLDEAPYWSMFDVTNPEAPRPIMDSIYLAGTRWDGGNSFPRPIVRWPHVWGVNPNALSVLDFGAGEKPVHRTFVLGVNVQELVQVDAGLLLAVAAPPQSSGRAPAPMQAIDISNPTNPVVGKVFGGPRSMRFGCKDRWLVGQAGWSEQWQDSQDRVAVWNLRDPMDPREVASFHSIFGPVWTWGTWAYVSASLGGGGSLLQVHDIGGIIDPDRAAGALRVVGGFVARIDVKRPGARYTVPPRVRVVSSTGSGAEVRAVLDAVGRVSAFEILSPGSGYSVDARVEVGSPDRTPRMAKAVPRIENGFVVGFDITDPGWGYDAPPPVRLLGLSGRNAVAEAVLNVDGAVQSIRVVNPGAGYAASTTALVRPPVVPEQGLELTSGHRVLRGGTLEWLQPYEWQELKGTTWERMALPIVTNPASSVVFLEGPVDGTPVRLARLPLPVAATATPSVVNGFLVGITVNEGGTGYATPPRVYVTGGGGKGASATAQVDGGKVVKVVVDNPGRGYVQAPNVTLDPPPVVSAPVTVGPALRLQQSGLSADLEYRLQSSEDLLEWIDVSPWSPGTEAIRAAFLDVSDGHRFYRLQRRPW